MASSRVDPLWPDGPPSGTNLATEWLHMISNAVPPTPSQEVPALLQSLLLQDLAIDRQRSQPGHVFCTLPVTPGITNRYKTLHGGAIGSLVEILGCAAIKSAGRTTEGMVTDINISYISGTPIKEEVEFEAKALRLGNKIAVAAVDVRNKKSQKAVAQGRVTMCFELASKL